mmetsp:Transcript_54442/g.146795  ORF Transcript_54442/g.146795 Transcript_54442/m.146795 type:complete len:92 (-) Transcript_54442:32-307(-)
MCCRRTLRGVDSGDCRTIRPCTCSNVPLDVSSAYMLLIDPCIADLTVQRSEREGSCMYPTCRGFRLNIVPSDLSMIGYALPSLVHRLTRLC